MNFKDVPIPSRMAHLPKDRRGYPIPVGVLVDTDGRPHFTINDEGLRQKAIRNDHCAICGTPLFRGRWLVGGPASAFHPQGAYIDPCMHKECAVYALTVCPYLAAPRYLKRIDDLTLDPAKLPGGAAILSDPTMIDTRPDPFVLIMAHKEDMAVVGDPISGFVKYLKPKKITRAEFWSKGVRLSNDEGIKRATALLREMEGAGQL